MFERETLERVLRLVSQGEVLISSHGYDELADDDITVREILAGATAAIVVDDIPTMRKVLAFCYCKGMLRTIPSMWSGAFPRGHLLLR